MICRSYRSGRRRGRSRLELGTSPREKLRNTQYGLPFARRRDEIFATRKTGFGSSPATGCVGGIAIPRLTRFRMSWCCPASLSRHEMRHGSFREPSSVCAEASKQVAAMGACCCASLLTSCFGGRDGATADTGPGHCLFASVDVVVCFGKCCTPCAPSLSSSGKIGNNV